MNFDKCSLGLNTRIKDKRNFIGNYSHELDKSYNIVYTEEDDKKKCEIFDIDKSNIDFTTKTKMSGIGDHYYPLCKEYKKKSRIGSDSGWNRIPVSGSNHKYKNDSENMIKVNMWIQYCQEREANLYYDLSEKRVTYINNAFEELTRKHEELFQGLLQLN